MLLLKPTLEHTAELESVSCQTKSYDPPQDGLGGLPDLVTVVEVQVTREKVYALIYPVVHLKRRKLPHMWIQFDVSGSVGYGLE